jgi:hypothetical protein
LQVSEYSTYKGPYFTQIKTQDQEISINQKLLTDVRYDSLTILPDTLVHTICNKLQQNYHIMHFPRLKYDPALYYLVREVYDLPDTFVSKKFT